MQLSILAAVATIVLLADVPSIISPRRGVPCVPDDEVRVLQYHCLVATSYLHSNDAACFYTALVEHWGLSRAISFPCQANRD